VDSFLSATGGRAGIRRLACGSKVAISCAKKRVKLNKCLGKERLEHKTYGWTARVGLGGGKDDLPATFLPGTVDLGVLPAVASDGEAGGRLGIVFLPGPMDPRSTPRGTPT
jgi:hypothetical protein